jgi:hypothetical protein
MGQPNWHGENELITEVDPDFDEVVLLDGIKSLPSRVWSHWMRLSETGWSSMLHRNLTLL